jgi:HK97 gp10 family phage protein
MARIPRLKTTFYAEAKLNLHTSEVLVAVNEALFEATQEIIGFDTVATAKELAPVLKHETKERRPGELRDSIDAKVYRLKGKRSGVFAKLTTACGYGGWVENGAGTRKKHPFLWPAFELNVQRLVDAVRENLRNLVSSDALAEEEHDGG